MKVSVEGWVIRRDRHYLTPDLNFSNTLIAAKVFHYRVLAERSSQALGGGVEIVPVTKTVEED